MSEVFLTTAQAAERLRVKPSQVRRLILAGRLPAVKFGRDYQITPEACDALPPRQVGWPAGRPRRKETER